MATTFVEYTGDGNATKQFTFPSYQESDVKVRVDGVLKTTSTHYNITNYTTTGGGNVVFTSGNIPSSPANIRIYRDTNVDTAKATYTAGSSVKAADLNNNHTQLLYRSQEEQIPNLIHSYDIDDAAIETSNIKDSSVTTAKIAADAVTNAKIADDSIDSEHYVDGSIDTQHIADAQITHVKLANDSVDGDNIQDDVINSEHYVAGSIDTEHIANVNVTTAKLANDAVTSAKLADNAVLTANITDANVTTAKIAADAVTNAKIADDSIDSEHYVDGSIDTAHIGDAQITTAKIADGAITDAKIAGGSLDNRYYTETELDAGQLDNRYYTEAESDARYFNISTGDTIKDGDTFPDNDTTIATTAAINDRIIDLVDDVGGFVPIANETSFPTANPDVNNGSGTLVSIKAISSTRTPSSGTVTIANGAGSGNTVTITGCGSTVLTAGFGVIVETTSTLHTYAFHRLVPKATEVTTVAGISSDVTKVANIDSDVTSVANIDSNVTAVAGNATNINAVATNATNINAVASNASNINAVAADASDIGVVAADGTDIGLVAGSIASVNTAASNINSIANFGDQYQVASSAPSTDGGGNALAAGDLYFDTSSNELRVHNGTTFQGGVTATGNLAGLGANTFTGNQTYGDNVKNIFGTGGDLEVFHNGSNSFIDAAGTGNILVQKSGTTRLEVNSSGIGVTGNITVSGNVDGRDVAADGTKLDGIASSSTANPNAIDNVVEDTTPQLGGSLDVQTFSILTSTSNGNVKLLPNGTGVVEVRSSGAVDGTLQLNCSANSHGIKLKSPPHSAGQSYTLTFPSSLTNNGVLTTTSSGGLSAGLLTNANVASNAAIAGTKISPDFGSQAVTTTNDLGSGDHTITGAQPKLLLQDSNNNPDWSIKNANGNLAIQDETASATRFSINSSNGVEFHMHAVPSADSTYDLGLTGTRWRNAYVDTYYGDGSNLTGINTDLVSDTSPQLGGDLDCNGREILLDDTNAIKLGNGSDLRLIHDGSNSEIKNYTGTFYLFGDSVFIGSTTAGEPYFKGFADGAAELYHNSQKKFETKSDGVTVTGELQATHLDITGSSSIAGNVGFGDNVKALFGAGNDLQIYHDGSNSYLDNNTGSLRIRDAGGAEKLRVSGTGVAVTGNITVTGTVDGIDIATDVAANTAKTTNATHTGEVTGATALTIADNVVDEANLKISNSPVNGYMLTAQSGNTGGLTWAPAAAGATGAGNDEIFWENGTNVTADYTITNGKNAGSFGPITIDSGVTVTVGAGETWTVV